jgi:hypothetical protein
MADSKDMGPLCHARITRLDTRVDAGLVTHV